jgi:hypothetical protein
MTDLHAKLDEVTAERDALRAQLEATCPRPRSGCSARCGGRRRPWTR